MDWLTQNWVWIAVIAGVLAFYFIGRRGHGGHAGGQGGCCGGAADSGARTGGDTGAIHAGHTKGGHGH